MSISLKGFRRQSPSNNAARGRIPAPLLRPRRRFTIICASFFRRSASRTIPLTGQPIYRQTPQQIVDQILDYPAETKIILLAPLVQNESGEFRDVIEKVKREGFVRIRVDGEIIELGRPEPIRLKKGERHTIEAVVDRLVVREGIRTRLADSVETALKWGSNRIVVLRERERKTSNPGSFRGPTANLQMGEDVGRVFRLPRLPRATEAVARQDWEEIRYSTDYGNPETGFSLGQLTPKHFSFNSHLGACPACHGLGTQLVCDPELMVTDTVEIARGRRGRAVAARNETDAGLLSRTADGARQAFRCGGQHPV